jgi:RecB family exonuclease
MTNRILINAGPTDRGAHRLETFARCPQLFAYKYVLKLEMPRTMPLVRGSLGHVGLAHVYARRLARAKKLDPEMYWEPHQAIDLAVPEHGQLGQKLAPLAKEALTAYEEYWDSEVSEIVAVEHPIATTVGGYRYTGRIDLILKDRFGRYTVVDHKFTSQIARKTEERYILALQFLGLSHIGSQLFGTHFNGVQVNLVGCGADFKFKRVPVEPAPDALSRFPDTVRDIEEGITRLMQSGRDPWAWPRNHSELMCLHTYGKCDGWQLCRWGKSALGTAEFFDD